MTVADLIRELSKYAPDDRVEIFIGDLTNKGMSTLTPATEVIRCPPRLGVTRFMDYYRTVWIK